MSEYYISIVAGDSLDSQEELGGITREKDIRNTMSIILQLDGWMDGWMELVQERSNCGRGQEQLKPKSGHTHDYGRLILSLSKEFRVD